MRTRRSVLISLPLLALLPFARSSFAAANAAWPDWLTFKRLYLSEDGRVIDRSVPQQITTSEGQSYGLFFALVANDREGFAKILKWTQDNLAGGDLSQRLPAWQ